MSEAPHVTHVPTMTGGNGRDQVRRFYETWFIGHWPEDTVITPVSRVVGENSVVDEVVISFTHDCDMPAILPGVAPTGRKVPPPPVDDAFQRVVGAFLDHESERAPRQEGQI